jgi:hypothetical protein
MADDRTELLGRWRVKFQQYTWEYVFTADGVVRWTDPNNNESGVGRWSLLNKIVYFSWTNSTAKESWNRPIKQKGQGGWIEASYGTGASEAEKIDQVRLPSSSDAADEIDLELDPTTGEYVQSDPKTHKLYIDRVFTAVAYGILPDGYYVYTQETELPILVPESMVDFGLSGAESERGKIYDSFGEAKTAANDSAARRRVAYFWGAGGAVVSPTVIGPGTTPELYSTIVSVRALRDQFVSVMLPAITMAIGMISGPSPTPVKGGQSTGRYAKRRGGSVPPRKNPVPSAPTVTPKVKPLNGQVSVGGGFENKVGSNLNPVKPGSGGPAKGIPNHVQGAMEDMGELFEPGSVKRMISSRLRYGDVDWAKGTQAAAKVMAPKGTVQMNVWTQSPAEQKALENAFKTAGFKNVQVKQIGFDGSSTMVSGEF